MEVGQGPNWGCATGLVHSCMNLQAVLLRDLNCYRSMFSVVDFCNTCILYSDRPNIEWGTSDYTVPSASRFK
jgi:hypothetical protein